MPLLEQVVEFDRLGPLVAMLGDRSSSPSSEGERGEKGKKVVR